MFHSRIANAAVLRQGHRQPVVIPVLLESEQISSAVNGAPEPEDQKVHYGSVCCHWDWESWFVFYRSGDLFKFSSLLNMEKKENETQFKLRLWIFGDKMVQRLHSKGKFMQKWKFLYYLFALMLFQTWISFFLLQNTHAQKVILKNVDCEYFNLIPVAFTFRQSDQSSLMGLKCI